MKTNKHTMEFIDSCLFGLMLRPPIQPHYNIIHNQIHSKVSQVSSRLDIITIIVRTVWPACVSACLPYCLPDALSIVVYTTKHGRPLSPSMHGYWLLLSLRHGINGYKWVSWYTQQHSDDIGSGSRTLHPFAYPCQKGNLPILILLHVIRIKWKKKDRKEPCKEKMRWRKNRTNIL